jgi:hypothetical protein
MLRYPGIASGAIWSETRSRERFATLVRLPSESSSSKHRFASINGYCYTRAARAARIAREPRPSARVQRPNHFAVTAIFTDGWMLQRTVKAPALSNV